MNRKPATPTAARLTAEPLEARHLLAADLAVDVSQIRSVEATQLNLSQTAQSAAEIHAVTTEALVSPGGGIGAGSFSQAIVPDIVEQPRYDIEDLVGRNIESHRRSTQVDVVAIMEKFWARVESLVRRGGGDGASAGEIAGEVGGGLLAEIFGTILEGVSRGAAGAAGAAGTVADASEAGASGVTAVCEYLDTSKDRFDQVDGMEGEFENCEDKVANEEEASETGDEGKPEQNESDDDDPPAADEETGITAESEGRYLFRDPRDLALAEQFMRLAGGQHQPRAPQAAELAMVRWSVTMVRASAFAALGR